MTVSIASGYDPGYLTKAVATGRENYYLSSVAEHGEPPGYWSGRTGAALGLEPGSEVRAEAMEPLYREFISPAGERLGNRPSTYEALRERVADKVAAAIEAEPGATAERRAQIWNEAMRETRAAVYFFDATYSVSKSVSVLHAGLQVHAEQAREAGQEAEAAEWERLAAVVWDGIKAGNQAMLDYAQDEAGYTRTGYHSATTGEWRAANEWVVASFPQHTSRDGDPQLHVHNAILNRVQRSDGADEKWRTLDGAALYRVKPALGALAERVTAEYLARELGVEVVPRADGNGWEVGGVSQALMDQFSSRRAAISPALKALAEAYEAKHGRAPSRRALFSMAQYVTLDTRPAKEHSAPSRGAMLARWEAASRETERQALSDVPRAALGRGTAAEAHTPDSAGRERVIAAAIADVQQRKANWTRYDLMRAIGRALPAQLGGLDAGQVRDLLEGLAAEALAPGGQVYRTGGAERVTVPEVYQRADGESVFRPHGAERYTSRAQLDLEERILAQAAATGAPALDRDRAAAALGADRDRIEAALWECQGNADSAGITSGQDTPLSATGLGDDQAMALYGILTSGRAVDVLVGPAGTGKTRAVAELARVWTAETGGRVVGLTLSTNAAKVMRGEGLPEAYNIADWTGQVEGSDKTRGHRPLYAGDILVIDEASMVATPKVGELVGIAMRRGAKVLLTGDPEQHTSPEASGAMRMIAAEHGHYQLTTVRRFSEEWERDASLRLRAGDPDVLTEYDQRGRIREGTAAEMTATSVRLWLADHLADRDALLLATSNARAAELAVQAREQLIALGRVAGQVDMMIGKDDPVPASTGDLIRARHNAPEIPIGDGETLTNRDILVIEGWETDRGDRFAVVRKVGERAGPGEPPPLSRPFSVPAAYLSEYGELAYAGNTHVAEGRTVSGGGGGYLVVDADANREAVYVGLTRSRSHNTVCVVTEAERAADLRPGARPAPELAAGEAPTRGNRFGVLAAALERRSDDLTAIEAIREELETASSAGTLAAMWRQATRDAVEGQADAILREQLDGTDYHRYRNDPERGALTRELVTAALADQDPGEVLRAAVGASGMKGSRSVAAVLHGRVRRLTGHPETQAGTWADRTPGVGDLVRDPFRRELADALDDRTRVLGERAAADPPVWALRYLGEPPADPAGREDWVTRAGQVAIERDWSGYAADIEAIGPAPEATSPERRASWHTAYTALGAPEDERELRGATDGQLWLARAGYERAARWAPPWVGEELRAMRLAEADSVADAQLAWARADAATGAGAEQARDEARSFTALAAEVATQRGYLAEVNDARRAWFAATERDRARATAADAELRRRHPDASMEPLPNADGNLSPAPEPAAAEPRQAESSRRPADVQLTLDGQAHRVQDVPQPEAQPEPEPARPQAEGQAAFDLGYVPETDVDPSLRARLEAVRAAAVERENLARRQAAAEAAEVDRRQAAHWQALADQRRQATWQPGRDTGPRPGPEREPEPGGMEAGG